MTGPLDKPVCITIFPDLAATARETLFVSLIEFAELLRTARAPCKAALRLFSMCSYGSKRTSKKSLRHDSNIRECFAVVSDYDGGRVSLADAAAALARAGVCALLVTIPSYTPERPRWRVIAPLSDPLNHARASATGFQLAEYGKLISRLAGVFSDNLAAESWTRSQGWYLGTVEGATSHGTLVIEDGARIDQLAELDSQARPKPTSPVKIRAKRGVSRIRATPIPETPDIPGLVDRTIPDEALPLNVRDALFALGDDTPGIHDALVSLCGKFAAEGMPQATARAVLRNAFDRRPEAARDARWQTRRAEVKRTLEWAYEREAADKMAAAEAPLSLPAPAAHGGNGATPPPSPPGTGAAPGSTPPPPSGSFFGTTGAAALPDLDLDASVPPPYTDEAMALVFAATHTDRLRFVQAWGKWFVWDDRAWQQDDTLRSFSLTRLLLRQAAASAPKRRIAAALADSRTVAAVERLARADRRLAATTEQWDADAHLLNTPAGVIDLTTGVLLPHDPRRHMTKITAVAPGGDCPRWHAFLDKITAGDKALQAYLQRVSGYSLTGSTREHKLFFGYGTGANGKSVFLTTLRSVLGSYAAVAAMETFTATQNEQHPCDLAMLRGARLVVAQETEGGKRWAESRIKLMTGGDAISARFMRQDFFTYTPAFKLFIAGNHRPGLRSVDQAMRRRLDLVPFAVTIPEAERDRHLTARLRREWAGILAWAIEGCLQWQRTGLAPPPAVTAATDEYLAGEDVIQTWIDECCTVDKTKAAYSSALYASFKAWAELAGEFVPSQRWFTAALADRDYRQGRAKRGQGRDQRTILGLALNSGAGTVPP